MTAKEKVLFYFGEWNNKGTNPANGCEIMFTSSGITISCGDLACSVYMGMDADRVEWTIAARILKLDTPKAAEIQWEEPQIDSETNLHFILGGGYKVEQFMSGGKIYYRAQFHDRPWDLGYLGQHDSFKDGQIACQDHKQKRLEALL